MPSNQFRQVGVPDVRRATTEVRQHLRRVQQRSGALLNRKKLPRPQSLLRTLHALEHAVGTAHGRLPMRRLALLQEQLQHISNDVQQGLWLGEDWAAEAKSGLRRLYQGSSMLLRELTRPRSAQRNEAAEQQYQTFLQAAADRGWKVPEAKIPETLDVDGVEQSSAFINQVGVAPAEMLQPSDDFGLVRCALLLLNDPPIPESTLVAWTRPPYNLDVFVVFGHYVVLPQAHVLGLRPKLADVEGSDAGIAAVNINRFLHIVERLDDPATNVSEYDLIRYPRRVMHHYYCPMLGLAHQDRRHFQRWDILINNNGNGNSKVKNADTKDRPRSAAR